VACALARAAALHWAQRLETVRAAGRAPEGCQPGVPAARLRLEPHPADARWHWALAGCGPRQVEYSPERPAEPAGWEYPPQAGPPLVMCQGLADGRAFQARARREVRRARLRLRRLVAHRVGRAAHGPLVPARAGLRVRSARRVDRAAARRRSGLRSVPAAGLGRLA
jgi:hypothetical protein